MTADVVAAIAIAGLQVVVLAVTLIGISSWERRRQTATTTRTAHPDTEFDDIVAAELANVDETYRQICANPDA